MAASPVETVPLVSLRGIELSIERQFGHGDDCLHRRVPFMAPVGQKWRRARGAASLAVSADAADGLKSLPDITGASTPARRFIGGILAD